MMVPKMHEIHIWQVNLTPGMDQEKSQRLALKPEEIKRADKLVTPKSRQRFIAARHGLRQVLSTYLNIALHEVPIAYHPFGKPYLAAPYSQLLQFNLAHSHEIAVYAVTGYQQAIGIDVEKIQERNIDAIAKRFFCEEEYLALFALSPTEKLQAFYRLWARKEALVKALGKGLTYALSHIPFALNNTSTSVMIENEQWNIQEIALHADYAVALATNQNIEKVTYFDLASC